MKTERRQHHRVPVAEGLVEPVEMLFRDEHGVEHSVPAILINLSEGGMSMVSFSRPPQAKEIEFSFRIPGLVSCHVTARMVRCTSKGDVHTIGLSFSKITAKDRACIRQMALDFMDCDTRISLSLPDACVNTCSGNGLCSKPQKAGPFKAHSA